MIRKFKEEDLNSVMNIWLNENIKAHWFVDENYWKNNYKLVKKMIPKAQIYVAEENGEINGFIGINDCFIEGLFVDEAYQGKGIGRALLNEAKERYDKLELSVYAKNERAVSFYEANGFEIKSKGVDESTLELECTMMWKGH